MREARCSRDMIASEARSWWWVFLLVGVSWLWIGIIVLRLDLRSIWVSQRSSPARVELIMLWIGFMSIFRGMSQVTMAFAIRRLGKEVAAG
jgi:uncharacterized membrane protein HdeD (DUF308 family)